MRNRRSSSVYPLLIGAPDVLRREVLIKQLPSGEHVWLAGKFDLDEIEGADVICTYRNPPRPHQRPEQIHPATAKFTPGIKMAGDQNGRDWSPHECRQREKFDCCHLACAERSGALQFPNRLF